MRKFNLYSGELAHASERDGYRWRVARVGQEIGGAQIGAGLYELPAGERSWPYHFHYGMEEWLLVVSGEPVLRTPAGEWTLRPGDVVCFPVGPEGAHQLTGPGRVLVLSANRSPETVEYPDSGKVGARPPGKVFRAADAADYWEGE